MEKENLTAETQRRRDNHAASELRASRNTTRSRVSWWHAHPHQFARWLTLLGILMLPASHLLAKDRPRAGAREEKPADGEPKTKRLEDRILDQLIAHVAASARALQVTESSSERISKPPAVAPGAPPLLSFRYFDGKQRHRFGNLDLVMDDAGH
ncbi:MAG TPA: hypothetical protein VFS12_12055 [Terriglobia bacterium]|nr:hypothetical protein [Terriglobia bacterium]